METEPTRPDETGMHRVAFSVDDVDEASRSPLGTAATRCAAWRPTATSTGSLLRGPSGIIVMLAEALTKG